MNTFDESRWPVVVMTANAERTVEDVAFFTESMDKVLARQTSFALVMDSRRNWKIRPPRSRTAL